MGRDRAQRTGRYANVQKSACLVLIRGLDVEKPSLRCKARASKYAPQPPPFHVCAKIIQFAGPYGSRRHMVALLGLHTAHDARGPSYMQRAAWWHCRMTEEARNGPCPARATALFVGYLAGNGGHCVQPYGFQWGRQAYERPSVVAGSVPMVHEGTTAGSSKAAGTGRLSGTFASVRRTPIGQVIISRARMEHRLGDSGGGVGDGGLTASLLTRERHTTAMKVVTVGRRVMVLVPPFSFTRDQTGRC